MRKRKWRRWIAGGLLAIGLVVVGGIVVGWLMFQHIPSWYRLVEVHPEAAQAVRNDLQKTLDQLNYEMARSKDAFQHRFTEQQINAWLAARDQIWPLSREWLPTDLSDPVLSISEQGVRIGVTYRHGAIQTVLSALFAVSADQQAVHVRLVEASSGSLVIPEKWVHEQLMRVGRDIWPVGGRSKYQHGPGQLPDIVGLYGGIELPNGWIWWDSKRPYRIISIDLEPQAAVVTFVPLPRQVSSR